MKITWHGHSFFEVETATGLRVLIDPFAAEGVTRVKPERLDADLVLVTHGHDDHVGSAAELGVPVVASYELGTLLKGKGAPDAVTMNVGGSWRKDGVRFHMTPALHSSGFHDDDAGRLVYAGNPTGFVIDDGKTRFYHAGDTGLFGDMRAVIADVLKPDVAAVPIGDFFTMGPEHAALAVQWLGVKTALPMHYNTFPPIRQDPQEWVRHVGSKAQALVPGVDESVEVEGARVVSGPRAAAGAR